MAVSLVRRNLTHRPSRLIGALTGVAMAVALVFTQLGFLNAMLDSTVRIINRFDGQLVILASGRQSLVTPVTFPRSRLAQARAVNGVDSVAPLRLVVGRRWRSQPTIALEGDPSPSQPASVRRSSTARVTLLLVDPRRPAICATRSCAESAADEWTSAIRMPGTVLTDQLASKKVTRIAAGAFGELDGDRLKKTGEVRIGGSLFTGGYLIASEQTGDRIGAAFPGNVPGVPVVDFGIIKVSDPLAIEATAARLRAALPSDVIVLRRESPWYAPWPVELFRGDAATFAADSYARRERWFWLTNTPVGFVFLLGVFVGVVVAAVIMYQILQSGIARHLAEYATLKAMGYNNRFLIRTVRREALCLAIGGFVPGLVLAAGFYELLERLTGLPLDFNATRIVVVFGLTVLSCLVAARLAVGKLFRASPAELF